MRRWLITLGVTLLVLGLVWPWVSRLGLGRLPGDIVYEGQRFRFYFPLATGLLLSAVFDCREKDAAPFHVYLDAAARAGHSKLRRECS